MPIDPRIAASVQPIQIDSPMQTLMQVAGLQQMKQNQQNQQERIELQRQEEERLRAAAQIKLREDQTARAARGVVMPGILRQQKRDEILATIQGIEDADMQAAALGILTGYEDKQSEINQRIATTSKNNADVKQMKLQQIANLSRGVRDVGKYEPAAIELAFKTAMLDDDTGVTEQYYNQWKEAPEIGKPLIDFLITQGGENITLGTNEQRVTPTGGTLASGRTETEEPKVDFNLFLPLYARDVLKIDTAQPNWERNISAANYTAAKTAYEKMNDQAARPGQPILVWTGQGPVWAAKPEPGQVPPGGVAPIQMPGGGPVMPPPTAHQRDKAADFEVGRSIFDELAAMSERVQRGHGAWARLKAPADKAAAKLNLDQDLALYTSMVQAFSPLLSRSLGHTGVLTELDVLRTEGALPATGDDEALAARKIAETRRVIGIISQKLNAFQKSSGGGGGTGNTTTTNTGGGGGTTTTTVPPTNDPTQDPDWLEFQRRRAGQKK